MGSDNKRGFGKRGEDEAVRYLQTKGFEILDRNYHYSKFGEIDIIAKEPSRNTVAFIEVKSGYPEKFGSLLEKITPTKIKTLYRLAEAYIYYKKLQNVYFRFDVVLVDYSQNPPQIRHIEDAFQLWN
ncbi:MAG: YraN family protein [Calditrichia bacterium]